MSSLKRKHSDPPDDSNHGNPADQPFASPHSKRRRFDLARNLSRLSLIEQAQAQAPIVQEQAVFQGSPLPSTVPDQDVNISPWLPPYPQEFSGDTTMDMDGEVVIPVINHPIVEEPIESTFTIPEVRMRHTSSYEPEKDRTSPLISRILSQIDAELIEHAPSGIIVTDLDSSEDEAESPLQTSTGSDSAYSVSQAFLSRVNPSKILIPLLKVPSQKLDSDASQALVLFRPSPWSAKDARELERIYRDRDEENPCKGQAEPRIEEPDADAMEVE